MIILDTNVLSALMLSEPVAAVVDWLDAQPRISIWTTSVSILEIRYGLQTMSSGRRQTEMIRSFEQILVKTIDRRIANLDAAAAQHTADLMTVRKQHGRMGDLRDAMIGGIVLSSRARLATRNTKHFDDLPIPLVNPWKD